MELPCTANPGGKWMTSASAYVRISATGPIAEIVIDRPERRNAVDLGMWKAIPECIAAATAADETRVVILRGGGDKAFVAGADISEFEEVRCDSRTNAVFTEHVLAATASIRAAPVPVIAAIRGFCIGGGVVLASACDLRIASEGSVFGVPAAKLGLGYELENYEALVRLVGHGAAAHMVLTARQFSAQEALRMGLVQEVVAPPELMAHVQGVAQGMARLAPLSLAAAKKCGQVAEHVGGRAAAQAAIAACYDSEDFREGRNAFREKRSPVFNGK